MTARWSIDEPFYIHDTSERTLVGDVLYPFAYDELMCRRVGEGAAPLVHVWRHEKALVLGLRDRRLPMAELGMSWLSSQGYQVGVRSSGGAAVPLDPGVINISLIVPVGEGKPDFRAGFAEMRDLIAETLQRFGVDIQTGEVKGSYCPGDFDLSIDGRKFCGISQRRQNKAYAVQAFVVVEGHAERRAQMVRMFYEMATGEGNNERDGWLEPQDGAAAAAGVEPDSEREAEESSGGALLSYPIIRPGTMGSLVSLAGGKGITMRTFTLALRQTLQQRGGRLERHPALPSMDELQRKAAELKQRYGG